MRNAVANYIAVHENDQTVRICGKTLAELITSNIPLYVQDTVLEDHASLTNEIVAMIPYVLDICINIYYLSKVRYSV